MNERLLDQLTQNYVMFTGVPPTSRRSLVNFVGQTVDLSITTLYEMIDDQFDAFGFDDYKPSVKKICVFLGVSPEDIFGLPTDVERVTTDVYRIVEKKEVTNTEYVAGIIENLRRMDIRMAEVVRRRFGFDEDREHTLEEIGTTYGLTRERIRQIEDKALNFLRRNAFYEPSAEAQPEVVPSINRRKVLARRRAASATASRRMQSSNDPRSITEIRMQLMQGREHLASLGMSA